jgi:hypothetical protein
MTDKKESYEARVKREAREEAIKKWQAKDAEANEILEYARKKKEREAKQ